MIAKSILMASACVWALPAASNFTPKSLAGTTTKRRFHAECLALAELCYRTLLSDGPDALAAVRAQVVTPALERLVEGNTLLSGLGFESSDLAAAHAIHNGLTTAPQSHSFFHGEKVAFRVLVQLVLEGSPVAYKSGSGVCN